MMVEEELLLIVKTRFLVFPFQICLWQKNRFFSSQFYFRAFECRKPNKLFEFCNCSPL